MRYSSGIVALSAFLIFSITGHSETNSLQTMMSRLKDFTESPSDSEISVNLRQLETQNLSSGAAKDSIWSGTYWPLRYGGLAAEYKKGFKTGLGGIFAWKKVKKRFEKKWEKLDPKNLSSSDLETLAPSEKFDLLLSDYDLSLTHNVWQSIEEQAGRHHGRLKMWEGVCHGWATAAIQAPRPVKMVHVKSRDGKYTIPFLPDDLKGLASFLWANSLIQENTKFAGHLCKNSRRDFDPITGLSNDPSCNGVDPALFHLALVHLMGKNQETFIINKDNDGEVWNQPLKSYQYEWFNVITARHGSLEESAVAVEKIENDVRRASRAPETKYVVGVELALRYIKETRPMREGSDEPSQDKVKKITYIYDLELDRDFNVVGGQWRNFKTDDEAVTHSEEEDRPEFPGFPGFIWKIEKKYTTAYSISSDTSAWNIDQPISEDFLNRSKSSAQFRYKFWKFDSNGNIVVDANGNYVVDHEELRPQPLSLIVHGLLRAAKDSSDGRDL